MEVYVISSGNGIYTALGTYFGVPVSTSILYRKEVSRAVLERDIISRFRNQACVWKRRGMGHNKPTSRIEWSFNYIDFGQFVKMYPQVVVELPLEYTPQKKEESKGLKKLYEITKDEKGTFVVKKHDKELLDEDEVKLILFQSVVNE